jgi:phosphoenolpyruvate---glycerone phosphotransferase subunit DhaL
MFDTGTLGPARFGRMLAAATEQIRAQQDTLSRLDSAVGDGDHGTTILRAMETASQTAGQSVSADLKSLFSSVGWAVMSCDGGSTGPLLGTFFTGLSEATPEKQELDCAGLIAALDAGVTRLQKQSRAKVGDKTMMDAFLPAQAALKAANPLDGIQAVLRQAAEAAAAGAEATRDMRARFGRARNLGDRVLGHLDPGAVSVSLIFKGFSEGA